MLVEWKAQQEERKEFLGDEYTDYDLVLSLPNGRPLEGQVISRALKDLIRKNGLPDVVFHSLRHTSTTYKLKLNGGDMKAVQGDTGHAQLKMVSDVYSHIIDEDRRLNADKIEKVFYQHQKPVEKETVQPEIVQPAAATNDVARVLELLNKSLELTSQLLQLLSGMGTQWTVCVASAD